MSEEFPIMRFEGSQHAAEFAYEIGLSKIQEAVISSHFMKHLGQRKDLCLYREEEYIAKSLQIDSGDLDKLLIPAILDVSGNFRRDRVAAAKQRAKDNYRHYGLSDHRAVGTAELITEIMFDRQFLRGARDTCSRKALCEHIKTRIQDGAPIEMVIPALPFKFSSPLKTRGPLPDFGEISFLLCLFEIASTIDYVYRRDFPQKSGRLSVFRIISDGSRFNRLVGEPDEVLETYRYRLALWIKKLGFDAHLDLVDYSDLISRQLPAQLQDAKAIIAHQAKEHYTTLLWSVFDPYNMPKTMHAASEIEPDSEVANPEGRFVSLLKSLIYTIRYQALKGFERLLDGRFQSIYRELTSHIFDPYTILPPMALHELKQRNGREENCTYPRTDEEKELYRLWMLHEAWQATINYLAEIKSDRELNHDPIIACLPGHVRWTIHSKSGQLALETPTALGLHVQAWAGSGVFKLTKKGKIKLCTLPLLALEGAGATPVRFFDTLMAGSNQALFYIYPDVPSDGINSFLAEIRTSFTRYRTS